MKTIEIDGSYGEGGGQVLRTSMALSAILGRTLKITNIRQNRAKPGLQPQHLMACLAASRISNGYIKGAEKDSSELFYHPGKIEGGTYTFDIRTAGTTILVAQTLIPILLHASTPSLVSIYGGTHLPKSPSYDYLAKVFIPAIKLFGANVNVRLLRTGYFPAGGGAIEVEITPSRLFGNSTWIKEDTAHGIIRLSKLNPQRMIGEREAGVLQEASVLDIQVIYENAFSAANSLTLWQGFRGACSLGQRDKTAEEVAREVCLKFGMETHDVDRHLADQLLLYGALAQGATQYGTSETSSHLTTNAYIIRRFVDRDIHIKNNRILVEA